MLKLRILFVLFTLSTLTTACERSIGPRTMNDPIEDSIGLDQEKVNAALAPETSESAADAATASTVTSMAKPGGAAVTLPKTMFAPLPSNTWLPPSALSESTPRGVGEPWGLVSGLTMFRGNPSRTFYGTGPLPTSQPKMQWRYPDKPMCSESCIGRNTDCKQWCGTGWTGQPVVYERTDGITEIIFGAYDRKVHFVNAATGKETRPSFSTGDLIKGSVTLDPDGYPLLYFGSRDNKYRVLALDRDVPTEIFHLDAYQVRRRLWNDDWDGNGSIVADRLFIAGENSWFYVVKLNRAKNKTTGKVEINPVIEVQMPGWTEDMLKMLHPEKRDVMISIESSPTVFGNRVYWANSGGMIVGVDWTRVKNKEAEIVFTYWTGDDTDATPIIDERGHLYVAVQKELDNGRRNGASAKRVETEGQLIKLDPMNHANPVLWHASVPARNASDKGGIWSTPALDMKRNSIIVTTHPGDLVSYDRNTGQEQWRKKLGYHEWSSPAVIGDQLLVGRCSKVGLEMFDLTGGGDPLSKWSTTIPRGCVESTPAVWKGRIYVGSRDGFFYGLGL